MRLFAIAQDRLTSALPPLHSPDVPTSATRSNSPRSTPGDTDELGEMIRGRGVAPFRQHQDESRRTAVVVLECKCVPVASLTAAYQRVRAVRDRRRAGMPHLLAPQFA
jgi:hypothetical protein